MIKQVPVVMAANSTLGRRLKPPRTLRYSFHCRHCRARFCHFSGGEIFLGKNRPVLAQIVRKRLSARGDGQPLFERRQIF